MRRRRLLPKPPEKPGYVWLAGAWVKAEDVHAFAQKTISDFDTAPAMMRAARRSTADEDIEPSMEAIREAAERDRAEYAGPKPKRRRR